MGNEVKRCVIIGSAPISDIKLQKTWILPDDVVFCADGGYKAACEMEIKPDLLLGDFDSLDCALPQNVDIIRYPSRKDDTDMMCAVKEALKRGFLDFLLLGGLGGRLDHTVANLCVLEFLALRGARAVLRDEKNEAVVISSGRFEITGREGETVSVFPFGTSCCTVSYEGLEYPLRQYTLINDTPLGVSNRVLSGNAEVWVHSGHALLLFSKN